MILEYMNEGIELAKKCLSLEKDIEEVSKVLLNTIHSGNKVIACGNGGSMCDAMHFAEELTGKYNKDRRPLAAIAISDPSHISCVANDYGYESIFSRYIDALGKEGDTLIIFSTSGNSKNCLMAAESAIEKRMNIVSFLGKDGGKLKRLMDGCGYSIHVNSKDSGMIQEMHIRIVHLLIRKLESELQTLQSGPSL